MRTPHFFLDKVEELYGNELAVFFGTPQSAVEVAAPSVFSDGDRDALIARLNLAVEQAIQRAVWAEALRCKRIAIDVSRYAADKTRHHTARTPGQLAAALESLGADIENAIADGPGPEVELAQFKRAFYSLIGRTCHGCAARKHAGQSFCTACMQKLPRDVRRGLFYKIKRKYVLGFEAALAILRPATPYRRRAPRWVRCWDLIGLILLMLAALALAATWFTPAQLKAAWLYVPFVFPLMMRVCAWCDEVQGEKCEKCGGEAKRLDDSDASLYECQNAECRHVFPRDPAKATHGMCPRCSIKKKAESVPALAKAVSA